ncbi:MAG: pilus assembly protein PilP [Desulfobacterales bacterium]
MILFMGCDRQPDATQTKQVVRKKIETSDRRAAEKETADQKISDKSVQPAPGDIVKAEAAQSQADLPPQSTKESRVKTVESPTATAAKKIGDLAYAYDPKGKLDPFVPIFRERRDAAEKKSESRRKVRRGPRTPLEKVSLNQLKLVAVMLASSGNKALVEEASGKGYIIKEGTYIGMNSGRVVDIGLDRVVVEEEVEDILGSLTIRNTEMKLQKTPGE